MIPARCSSLTGKPAMGGSQLTLGWVETTNQFSAILLLVVSCKQE